MEAGDKGSQGTKCPKGRSAPEPEAEAPLSQLLLEDQPRPAGPQDRPRAVPGLSLREGLLSKAPFHIFM